MPLPFLITCTLPSVGLYQLSDGRFQLIEQGPLAPFMYGYRYLLVEKALAEFLEHAQVERVGCKPAVLFNRATGEEHHTHVQLHVGHFFTENQLLDLALEGPRLLTMNDQYYFATPELKAKLEAGAFSYLRFSEGLSAFASNAT